MKKVLRKKLQTQKSNRMIIAVAVGLTILILALFVIFVDLGPRGKEEVIRDYTSSIKRTSGIVEVKIDSEKNQFELLYDQLINSRFKREVSFILQSMSRELTEIKFKIRIYKNSWGNLDIEYFLQNGKKVR
jgi:hypothetical protein